MMDTTKTIYVGTFLTSCFSTTIGIIVSVSFLTFNIFHRHKRFMKMSSPRLNNLISFGGILLNIVCLMYGMDYFFAEKYGEGTVTCQMRLWLMVLSISLVFAPIFAKGWRVHKIFLNTGVKKVVIKDSRLFMICGMIMCMDAVLLFLWQIIDLMESKRVPVLVTNSNTGNSTSNSAIVYIQECTCDNIDIWLCLLFLWKSLVFSYGLYIAWKIRNILLPPMKDSPSIVISVIFTMFITSLVVVLSSVLRHDPNAVYIIHILAITISSVVVQITVFLPKVTYWWRTPIEKPVRLSTSMYEYGDHSEEEMYQLIAENRSLKKTLNEKTLKLSNLEETLQTAKHRLKSISDKDSGMGNVFDVDLSEYKLDSGLDVDLSETNSTEDNLSRISRNQRQHQLNQIIMQDEQETDTHNKEDKHFQQHKKLHRSNSDSARMAYRKQRSRISMYSLQQFARTAEFCESVRSTNDIAGSVAKSYNLDDNEDTLSYVSSYLPLKRTRRKLNYTLKESAIYSSPEDELTLSNDQLYPSYYEDFVVDTVAAQSSHVDVRDKPTVVIPTRHKKYKTPKPSYERTIQGDKIVVRKCYYL